MKGTFAFCENDQHDNLYISFILQLVLLLLISFSSVQFHAIFFSSFWWRYFMARSLNEVSRPASKQVVTYIQLQFATPLAIQVLNISLEALLF